MFRLLFEEIIVYIDYILRNIPGKSGMLLRKLFWRGRFGLFGEKSFFNINCFVVGYGNIEIGDNVRFNDSVRLYANNGGKIIIGQKTSVQFGSVLDAANDGKIVLGDNIMIGPNVYIRASNHEFTDLSVPIRDQGHKGGHVIIGNDVWIGTGVVILPDVTIGDGSVIGAGSVVTRSIPGYGVAVGNPAKVIKFRKEN